MQRQTPILPHAWTTSKEEGLDVEGSYDTPDSQDNKTIKILFSNTKLEREIQVPSWKAKTSKSVE